MNRYEPRRIQLDAEELQVHIAIGEQIQRGSRLLVRAPKQRRKDEQHEHGADATPILGGQGHGGRRRIGGGTRRALRVKPIDGRLQPMPAQHILNQSEHHAHAGTGETEVPIDSLGEPARDERPQEGAEVDSHVEDREPRVAPFISALVQ